MDLKTELLTEYNKRKAELENKIKELESALKSKENELKKTEEEFKNEILSYKERINELETKAKTLTNALSKELYLVEHDDGTVKLQNSINNLQPLTIYDETELYHSTEFPNTWKRHLKKAITKEDVCSWVEKHRIPEDIYKELRQEMKPLPKICYVNYDEADRAWAQMHIRGLEPDDVKKYKLGKISFEDLVDGHSIHLDWRLKFKNAFVQWVITQDHVKDYFDTIIGRTDEKTGNVSKGLAIVKPSGEEPERVVKAEKKEPILTREDAKLIKQYVLFDKSYMIPPGEVGCVAAHDLVLTPEGYKFVDELKEGDLVYTGCGRFRPILKIWDRGIVHNRFSLTPMFGFKTIYYHHNIYTKDGLKESETITQNDKLLLPKPHLEEKEYPREIILTIEPGYEKKIAVEEDFMFFLGFFAGDGSVLNHDKGQISLDCANEDEADCLEFLVKSIFGISHVTRIVNPNGNYISLRFIDRGLAHWLCNNCYVHYGGRKHKILPQWIYYLPDALKCKLLDGLIQSDGYVNHRRIQYATESRRLAGQIFLLLLTLGELPSIKSYMKDSRYKIYNISWPLKREKKPRLVDEDDRYYYIPVLRTEKEHGGSIHIYDIAVADDHNFVVLNHLVKNSTPYKWAYMCAIWLGSVKAGVQREDNHEYFSYPSESLPNKNKELFNGRFIIRAFKAGKDKRWWVWKAIDDPYPMDSIMHADTGHYWPIPAGKLEKFGREAYRAESIKKFKQSLKC